jgi:RND family efflux transporter MFP subunit
MNIFSFIKTHKATTAFIAAAMILVFMAIFDRTKNEPQEQLSQEVPAVSLISIGDYRQEKTIDISGATVKSLDQVDLRAQFSAPIEFIGVKLGDRVAAGQILVQLRNDDIKAQLAQTQAGLTAAQSRLDELKRGSRAEDLAISRTAASEAKNALVNSIKDAYAKSDDAIHNHIDKFFISPRGKNAQFSIIFNVSGNQVNIYPSDVDLARNVASQKYNLESMFEGWKNLLAGIDSSSDNADIENALAVSEKNLQQEIDFMNMMAPIVNNFAVENTSHKQILDGYKNEFSAARAAISGSLNSLQGSKASWRAATKALDLKLAGSSNEQIKQAQAAVDQAQALTDAVKATMAKTSILSPIAGEISYISGNVGEFVSAGQLVASVTNPDALQIQAYASENDLPFISQGNSVLIEGGARGIVQTVSPAINTQTKRAEINILITQNGNSPIMVGQTVSVKISSSKLGGNAYLLPIESVQFSKDKNCVFAIDENSAIKEIPVTIGEIVGERIYATGELSDDMKIISSARGLKSGDKVQIR